MELPFLIEKNIKNILVTGGTGFIGTHLISELLKHELNVFSLQRHLAISGHKNSSKATHLLCDLQDAAAVKKLIRKLAPDAVIHLAAISSVGYSYDHPKEVIESNLLGTSNLVHACLHEDSEIKHFLFASTAEAYGNGPNPKREEMMLKPNSPYAISKVACEMHLMYLYNAHNFPVTILRNFNTYGRKHDTRYVVEHAICQMIRGTEILLCDPNPTRDFMYVDDHVNSYLSCLGRDEALGEIFNFCTGNSVSIRELVDLISDLIGFQGKIIWNSEHERPLDTQFLAGDHSKAKRMLGWVPKYTLEEGLKLTIQHFKNNLH